MCREHVSKAIKKNEYIFINLEYQSIHCSTCQPFFSILKTFVVFGGNLAETHERSRMHNDNTHAFVSSSPRPPSSVFSLFICVSVLSVSLLCLSVCLFRCPRKRQRENNQEEPERDRLVSKQALMLEAKEEELRMNVGNGYSEQEQQQRRLLWMCLCLVASTTYYYYHVLLLLLFCTNMMSSSCWVEKRERRTDFDTLLPAAAAAAAAASAALFWPCHFFVSDKLLLL